MPGVFYLANIFQFIIDSFNQSPFVKQYFFVYCHSLALTCARHCMQKFFTENRQRYGKFR